MFFFSCVRVLFVVCLCLCLCLCACAWVSFKAHLFISFILLCRAHCTVLCFVSFLVIAGASADAAAATAVTVAVADSFSRFFSFSFLFQLDDGSCYFGCMFSRKLMFNLIERVCTYRYHHSGPTVTKSDLTFQANAKMRKAFSTSQPASVLLVTSFLTETKFTIYFFPRIPNLEGLRRAK